MTLMQIATGFVHPMTSVVIVTMTHPVIWRILENLFC